MDKDSKKRVVFILIGMLFLLIYFLVNAQEYTFSFLVYIVIGTLSFLFYVNYEKIGFFKDLEGINQNWKKDSLLGIGLGVGTIILGGIFNFIGVIGIPPVQSIAGVLGRFVIIVPTASIFESVFFHDFLHDFLYSLGINKFFALILVGLGFALFHFTVYGASLKATGGSYFSAGLMGFVFGVVTEWRNSLATTITYHGTLNTWIGFIKLNVVLG